MAVPIRTQHQIGRGTLSHQSNQSKQILKSAQEKETSGEKHGKRATSFENKKMIFFSI